MAQGSYFVYENEPGQPGVRNAAESVYTTKSYASALSYCKRNGGYGLYAIKYPNGEWHKWEDIQ